MKNKIQNPDNELFINLINYLSSNYNYKNKFISEKTGIKSQRISDLKFGSSSVTKKELNDLQQVFSVDLQDYIEPTEKTKKGKNIDTEDFVNFTEHLLKLKRLSLEDIGTRLDVNRLKIANIRAGRSSADRFMLSKLKDVFSEELKDYVEPIHVQVGVASEYAKVAQVEKLEKEVQDLKDIVFKLLAEKVREEQEENKKNGHG